MLYRHQTGSSDMDNRKGQQVKTFVGDSRFRILKQFSCFIPLA